jgi:hypothetical protein
VPVIPIVLHESAHRRGYGHKASEELLGKGKWREDLRFGHYIVESMTASAMLTPVITNVDAQDRIYDIRRPWSIMSCS